MTDIMMMMMMMMMIVTLPMFQWPVLYEEKPYPGVGLPLGFPMPRTGVLRAAEEKGGTYVPGWAPGTQA
jgi:hypothetical protein